MPNNYILQRVAWALPASVIPAFSYIPPASGMPLQSGLLRICIESLSRMVKHSPLLKEWLEAGVVVVRLKTETATGN